MERGFLSQKGGGVERGVKEKNANASNRVQSPLVDQTNTVKTGGGSYPPLPIQGTTPAKNTLGGRGNGIDVVVSVELIQAISERNTWGKFGLVKSMLNSFSGLFSFQFSSTDGLNSMLENGLWFIRNHPLILQEWNPDVDLLKKDVGNVLVWVKLHGVPVMAFSEDGLSANVELKDNIVVAIPKIMREGYYTCTVRVEYEWKPPSGNKKKCVAHTNEVSNLNSFDVLNSVDNDVDFGTNGGTINFVNNEASSSESSFMSVENSSTSNTPTIDKIRKFEYLLIDGKAILVDEAGNPLKKVKCLGDYDSEDEVASVDSDMARSLASERVGFDTQSFLELWRESYGNGNYDEDPYNDNMYEGKDLHQEI
uniref:DUF4283 domain-containing protein n=1 Tax=Tanacetum cinerariifolium TaxID=118510 RepID=A0A6L2K3M4_TANCI|nr:hypothetical protein [Tanacetum cinerariifolium]